MGRVDQSIAAPRHRVPRERVPAGSVGIAGLQTGVYPVESPGGWQLIGRTATVMFDPNRDRPSLLAAGDLVRFVAARAARMMGDLLVIKPGLLTTVQDLGRYGHQAWGVPVAGPMDAFSHRLANQLVGNPVDAATLEITLLGPELMVEADTTMAIAGAQFEVACGDRPVALNSTFTVQNGQRLKFGRIVRRRARLSRGGRRHSDRAGPGKPCHAPGQPHGRIQRPGADDRRSPADRCRAWCSGQSGSPEGSRYRPRAARCFE